jgi:hypothetical protein
MIERSLGTSLLFHPGAEYDPSADFSEARPLTRSGALGIRIVAFLTADVRSQAHCEFIRFLTRRATRGMHGSLSPSNEGQIYNLILTLFVAIEIAGRRCVL